MAAASVTTAPATAQATSSKDELLVKLDESLERYLHTLDAYQQAQQKLSSHLSAGYLSLAQANFSNAARTRYGQDYYDERMRALRKVTATDNPGSNPSFSVTGPHPPNKKGNSAEGKHDKSSTRSEKEPDLAENDASESEPAGFETATKPESVDNDDKSRNRNGDEGEDDDDDASKRGKDEEEELPKDTIRWFGILVPQSLRAAQGSFVEAVEGPVPAMATLMAELRVQEIEIGRLRKQIKKL